MGKGGYSIDESTDFSFSNVGMYDTIITIYTYFNTVLLREVDSQQAQLLPLL